MGPGRGRRGIDAAPAVRYGGRRLDQHRPDEAAGVRQPPCASCAGPGLCPVRRWHYAERNWAAEAGSYVFEPPGDIHTLIAEEGESQTLFWIQGALIELDEAGRTIGYTDVFTRIEQASRHFARVGLGRDYVRKFIR